jgi:hypothetical protein
VSDNESNEGFVREYATPVTYFRVPRDLGIVRVVHRPAGTDEERVLATTVEFADGLLSQGIGLMFRRSVPEEFALVFWFGRVGVCTCCSSRSTSTPCGWSTAR